MNAAPLLSEVARASNGVALEAVLIGKSKKALEEASPTPRSSPSRARLIWLCGT